MFVSTYIGYGVIIDGCGVGLDKEFEGLGWAGGCGIEEGEVDGVVDSIVDVGDPGLVGGFGEDGVNKGPVCNGGGWVD